MKLNTWMTKSLPFGSRCREASCLAFWSREEFLWDWSVVQSKESAFWGSRHWKIQTGWTHWAFISFSWISQPWLSRLIAWGRSSKATGCWGTPFPWHPWGPCWRRRKSKSRWPSYRGCCWWFLFLRWAFWVCTWGVSRASWRWGSRRCWGCGWGGWSRFRRSGPCRSRFWRGPGKSNWPGSKTFWNSGSPRCPGSSRVLPARCPRPGSPLGFVISWLNLFVYMRVI